MSHPTFFCFGCVLSSLITVGRTVAFSLFVLHWMCVIFLPLHNSLFVLSDLVCRSKSWSGCCACVISFTSWMAARSLLLWRERGCSAGVRFLKMILRVLFFALSSAMQSTFCCSPLKGQCHTPASASVKKKKKKHWQDPCRLTRQVRTRAMKSHFWANCSMWVWVGVGVKVKAYVMVVTTGTFAHRSRLLVSLILSLLWFYLVEWLRSFFLMGPKLHYKVHVCCCRCWIVI